VPERGASFLTVRMCKCQISSSQISAGTINAEAAYAAACGGSSVPARHIVRASHLRIIRAPLVNAADHLYAVPGKLFGVYDESDSGELVSVSYELVGTCGDQTLFRLICNPSGRVFAEVEVPPTALPENVTADAAASQFTPGPGYSHC